ncbi:MULTISPECIES: NAD-dependent succinate-semialdehyde dehydrogenase [unclassified Rothia (in: high G+C Gram-positive bacteria)]|jgi:succinate-semialdehyde dehydrogenase|uniref:NAD-dependent succinate-semialdehyde dehydrogenase n=1 Tax=unclassified Rothia (in: high G+C Gram-positive bacteria) TaxID=2689056 RepID=UPI0008A28A63|nr:MULTISPECIES: NAD-dependent succinate-semialdehyde dehydrogenase [unclassified Rothia (in: high G+C Gram-positive bacteria)]OFL77718.1 NAD-dependent succinate-semialdehyde dehydrogenase [Rothia sp. HMSC075F09]OFR25966.1 NAD-dependent succinate-semialdehyde dehydrogenase [Rothia sp. HMSC066G02]
MTTSPENPAAKSAQLRGRTEPHMQSINMPQLEPIDPYERPSYPFFYVPTDLLIGGSWVTGDNGSFPVHNPSCGQILAHVADASVEQGIEALDAACDARTSWAATSVRERADILNRAYTLMTQRTEVIARLMTLEMGKPLDQSRGEVAYAANYLRWYAEEAARNFGRTGLAPESGLQITTVRRPVGPCLLITPWNFPLAMAARKVAPALAAGCTAVLKPASLTPLSSLYFASLMREAGLPDGVLNVVTTSRTGEVVSALMADERLRKVSFTGSTAVGRTLLAQASQNVLRTSMELGGNAPFIVFEDADIPAAVEGAYAAKMRNMGEACTAANRFIVHEDVAEEFTRAFVERMEATVVGDGTVEGTDCGPLIQPSAVESMLFMVEDALGKGALLACGGYIPELEENVPSDTGGMPKNLNKGNFIRPTVVTGVTDSMRVWREEIFGPVAPIATFSGYGEEGERTALRLANDTEYGLAAYVYTSNHPRFTRMAAGLEFGLIGYNSGVISNAAAPFGGVKQSGMGREGGPEGLEEYTELQYIGAPNPFAG